MNIRIPNPIMINIADLKPYAKNTKRHDATQIANVAESMRQFGFVQPFVIDADNSVVIGHCRLLAAQQLGVKELPCIRVDYLTQEQIKALRILDNKLNESAWDFDLLKDEIAEIDLSGFEVDFGLPDDILDETTAQEDDYVVPDEVEPRVHFGEIWQLGRHRLMCGDSTELASVQKLIGGGYVDLVVTDPPYNVNYESNDGKTIQNDNMGDAQFFQFLCASFSTLYAVLKEGGAFYIWHADSKGKDFRNAVEQELGKVRQCLIWNKNSLVLGRQDYQWKHEPCLYGWKGGAPHYFVDDRTQTTIIEDASIDLKKLKKDEMLKLLQDVFADKISTTVLCEDKPSRNSEHPTMKPIKLLARLIKNSSKTLEKVLDTFGGSGSTLIACEQLNRTCYTMELDEKYATVIVDRWEKFTGQKAQRIE